MTVENSRRLFKHYVKTKNKKAAEDMLAKYPEFGEKKEAQEQKQKE